MRPPESWFGACARTLLHLYPGPWRQRYADEFLAILDVYEVSPRTLVDLLVSALAARFDPQFRRQRRLPMVRGRLTGALAFGAFATYFLAFFAWLRVDEALPGPGPLLYHSNAALWQQSERLMLLSVQVVYFGVPLLSLVLCVGAIRQWWRTGQMATAVVTGVAVVVSLLSAAAVLLATQSGSPPGPALFAALVLGPLGGVTSIGLASSQIASRPRLRLGAAVIAAAVVVAMALALVATVVFAVDLSRNGVPIVTFSGLVVLYAPSQVPPSGWGYDVRPGGWPGTLGASIGLMIAATGLSFTALWRAARGTGRLLERPGQSAQS